VNGFESEKKDLSHIQNGKWDMAQLSAYSKDLYELVAALDDRESSDPVNAKHGRKESTMPTR